MFPACLRSRLLTAAALISLTGITGISAQGSLTPPGAPSASMVSLDQVEPRTPVESLPGSATAIHTISAPGSYCLTDNLTGVSGLNGIEITAEGVTLDLNGFEMTGVSGSLRGVAATAANVTVINGTVRGWGDSGVHLQSESRVEGILAVSNAGSGITLFARGVVHHCVAEGNDGMGGISTAGSTIISECVSVNNTLHGISIGNESQVIGCVASNNEMSGIYSGAGGFSLIRDNTCNSNAESGIDVCADNLIINNTCCGNGTSASYTGAGIEVRCGGNRVEGNLVCGNEYGLNAYPNGNEVVVGNTAHGNSTANYHDTTGNDFGPIGTAATATSPWANISH